tara:strand:+ start:335 stop:631 length:297 start_codon:yes stop_codon:yes gene_type:complete
MKPSHGLLLAVLCAACSGAVWAQSPQTCEQAWAEYDQFKKDNKMEPERYAYTVYGANVRALCGAQALPVPPGVDTPPRIIRRPPPPPPKPPQNPAAPR